MELKFEIDFPQFEGNPEDLPKAEVIAVQLFQDGSLVYAINGERFAELPRFVGLPNSR